ncbi:MAG: hypothetical protein AABN33_26895 [Acidobacteriota bacterium]
MNPYALHMLRIESLYRNSEAVDRALAPIGDAIASCAQNLEEAEITADSAYIDVVIDSETEMIETHLGTAFVVCQTYVTSIVSSVMALHKFRKKETGVDLLTTKGNKVSIISFGSHFIKGSCYTEIQTIDAFANYFKHRDEWQQPWSTLSRPAQRHTIQVLLAAGGEEGSTGNLRTGAEVLGNSEYKNVHVFTAILTNWCNNIRCSYDSELRSDSLL